jgi:hypothetical protein
VLPFVVNNLQQIKSHENGVYNDGVTLMPNFVKISQLLHEVTGTHISHEPKKGKWSERGRGEEERGQTERRRGRNITEE